MKKTRTDLFTGKHNSFYIQELVTDLFRELSSPQPICCWLSLQNRWMSGTEGEKRYRRVEHNHEREARCCLENSWPVPAIKLTPMRTVDIFRGLYLIPGEILLYPPPLPPFLPPSSSHNRSRRMALEPRPQVVNCV